MSQRPRSIGEPRDIHHRELEGYLFPWCDEHPVLLNVIGSPDLYLPIFSTLGSFKTKMAFIGAEYQSIKRIDDVGEFLDSLPFMFPSGECLRVIVDPYRTEEGMIRFTELLRG